MKTKSTQSGGILAWLLGAVVVLVLLAAGGVQLFVPGGYKTILGLPLDRDEALSALDAVVADADYSEQLVTRRARVTLAKDADLTATLPAIDQFDVTVQAGNVDLALEIFASSEKSGSQNDGWLNEVAVAFNRSGARLADGRRVGVSVRRIASGTGYQFIASGKYTPDAYTPSNHLWVRMAEAAGVTMTPISERLVGNVAGVVLSDDAAATVNERYGDLSVPNLLNAVVQGDLVMGYTNPFASSTGLNFLVTVLTAFTPDGGDPLAEEVVSAFESFQRGVPFVALTTLQMRDSVVNEGSLDAFVMEYQTFARTPELASGYRFVPFGIRHDNPLYLVGNPDADRREGMTLFAEFAGGSQFRDLARRYGFDDQPDHADGYAVPEGSVLIRAQRLWKEKKDGGRPVVAVFLADVSGSMRGTRLARLKQALVAGADFIDENNAIGLVSFSSPVTTLLPVKRFNLAQKATFVAAVEDLRAGGNTAMYDGVAVSLKLLEDAVRNTPDAKPLLFVLSDGATNRGAAYSTLAPIVEALEVPIYTIGYEADLTELKRLSGLVEAASIDAGEGEISYRIGALLNAQM